MKRELEITIFDRNSIASATTTITFDTVQDFMFNTDQLIDSLPFYKVYTEFETDIFSPEELEILKERCFI